jgi:hypothetical protein
VRRIGAELLALRLHPSPLRCFLEVLILNDFKSLEPEVLILGDFKSLFPEVLILVELKSRQINKMREAGNFLEVLILGDLTGAMCTNGWNCAGATSNDKSCEFAEMSRGKTAE